MALKDKLREQAQQYLEPGEEIQAVFPAMVGPTPWLVAGVGAIIFSFLAKYRVVVVTDKSILVLKSGALAPSKPKGVEKRLPRDSGVGPFQGKVWGKVEIGGERHWVHRRFLSDVESVAKPPAAA